MITLTTTRLTLAPHRPEDFDAVRAMWSHPDVVRYIGGRSFSDEESWARLLRYAGLWTMLGFGYWAAHETITGRYVGDFGLADFRRDIQPRLGDAPEAGWAMAPWAHGRGLAEEALVAVLGWADRDLDAPRTVCLIDPANVSSIRLAEKLGYRAFADVTYKGHPSRLFERMRG